MKIILWWKHLEQPLQKFPPKLEGADRVIIESPGGGVKKQEEEEYITETIDIFTKLININ